MKLSLAFAVLLAAIITDAWETKWKRQKLSDHQLYVAAQTLVKLLKLKLLRDIRSEALAKDPTAHLPQYRPIDWSSTRADAYRFKPLCQLVFVNLHPNNKITDDGVCSCILLGPQLALTAAHCFTDPAVPPQVANNAIYVVPQYGLHGKNEAKHWSHTGENARLVSEWWIPEEWLGMDKLQYHGDLNLDVAFVKLATPFDVEPFRNPADGKEYQFYRMVRPDTTDDASSTAAVCNAPYTWFDKKVLGLGYAREFQEEETAVDVRGKLVETYCGLVELEGPKRGGVLGWMVKQGTMDRGGSGGPWIVDDEGSKYDARNPTPKGCIEPLKMAVLSITSSGYANSRNLIGPRFTRRLLEVVPKIRDYKKENPKVHTDKLAPPVEIVQFALQEPQTKKKNQNIFCLYKEALLKY